MQHQDRSYASFRVGVRFNSTNTTQVRDEMWNGVGSPGIAKPCSGGYNTILYKNVAALFAKHKFTVSQNSECHWDCAVSTSARWQYCK
jgi:hypothetical protein